jgi:succinoglycan biosynthesis protein ExoO
MRSQEKDQVMTTVSVVIPARNAARWIKTAVSSVATQTLAACEVIVIDNASTDDTCAVVKQLQVTIPELILVRNPRDLGVGASRNIGIRRATGDWIALLDADDWFAPTRLRHLTELGERTGASMVADNQFFTPGPDEPPLRTLIEPHGGQLEMIDVEAFLRRDRIVAIGNFGLLKPIFRREFLQRAGVLYDEDPAITIGEDSLFYISCLITGERILLTDEALYFYRRHPPSLTYNVTTASVRIFNKKNRELLARLRPEAGSSLAEAIDQALADQDDIMAYRELLDLLRTRRWLAALLHLFASPGRTFFLLHRATQGLTSRIAESQLRRSIINKIHALPSPAVCDVPIAMPATTWLTRLRVRIAGRVEP